MWEEVLLSDECNIRLMAATPTYVRRPTGGRYSEKFVPNSKQCSILDDLGQVFGIRSRKVILPPTEHNYERRTMLVGPRRTPEADDAYSQLHNVHAQRRSMPHVTSREVIGPWPGQSPNFNPIKNLWHILKTKVYKEKPTTLAQLRETILRVWCTQISRSVCKALVHSMPKGITDVLKNKGPYTEY